MFSAVLDANVLWPSLQRDFLLSLAIEGLFRPLWSNVLLDEVEYNESAKRMKRGAVAADATRRAAFLRAEMARAFPDAVVRGWEALEGSYGLPDPDDEHVLAAAVVGGAGVIVTHNVKDFPSASIPDGIDVVKPAQFAFDTVSLDPSTALRALEQIALRSGRGGDPPRTVAHLKRHLVSTYRLHDAVALIPDA